MAETLWVANPCTCLLRRWPRHFVKEESSLVVIHVDSIHDDSNISVVSELCAFMHCDVCIQLVC